MSPKNAVLEAVNALPADATPDEIWDRVETSLREFDADPAWVAEINRRVDDLESGRVQGVPAADVFHRLRKKFG